jgi:hypothetical protein
VGGLSLAAVRGVVDAAGDEARSAHDAFAVAYAAIGDEIDLDADDELAAARLEIDAWVARRGWTIVADAPALAMLARTLVAAERFGFPDLVHAVDSFADLLDPIAELEVATIDPDSLRERMVERVVVGTLVYERAISATRRLLLEHHSAQLFGGT